MCTVSSVAEIKGQVFVSAQFAVLAVQHIVMYDDVREHWDTSSGEDVGAIMQGLTWLSIFAFANSGCYTHLQN
jgi:hypothetical protein